MRKLPLLIAVLLWAPLAGADYKCVDERGRTHLGDTPPPGCANVMMYEVTKAGKVLREIPPSLTEAQIKAKQEADQRRREADKVAAEQRRKDLALLSTYSSEKEIEVTRDRNIDPIVNRIKVSKERLVAIDKRTTQLEEEMEFYKAGKSKAPKGKDAGARPKEVPFNLTSEMQRLQKEKETIAKTIVDYEREIEQLRAKFEADRKRWVALKAGGLPPQPKPADMTPASGKPADAKALRKN